ncbi:MAG: hypothetical protein A2173_10725 [Planctomycetes bacterium RBG_13_44_8b]|nr:MAG: hypothetical protein A2173_10725 [Planctomycetes bacterium RBG_13_44_8b]
MKKQLGVIGTRVLVGIVVALAIIAAAVAIVTLDTTGEKGSGLSKEFTYDLYEIAKIDPNLILYKELGMPIRTGFIESHAIVVVPDGAIYVAGDKAIRIYFENGQIRNEIKLAEKPACLDVAADGKIYIGMKDHVEVYDNQGQCLSRWKSANNEAIFTNIAVYKNDVFVADAGNRIVIHYDMAGNAINHIGKKDTDKNIPGFLVPSPYFDLAVAPDGLLRVVNPGLLRIEAYTFEGDLEFWWGEFSNVDIKGFTGCCNPVTFAMLEDGSYITCEKGLVRVKIYNANGIFVGVVAGPQQLVEAGAAQICYLPEQCQKGGFDVAVDAKGRVYVLDTIKNIVRIFTRVK